MSKRNCREVIILIALITSNIVFSSCEGDVSYRPPFSPIKFVLDTLGNISIQGEASLVTPIGAFSLNARIATSEEAGSLLVIIRDKRKAIDRMYRIRTGDGEFICQVNGSVTLKITNRLVIVDISNGDVKSIEIQRFSLPQEILNATVAGDVTLVSALLNQYPSLIKTQNTNGASLLHIAAMYNRDTAIAELFLANEADVNAENYAGSTALHYAAINNNEAITRWLIAHEANVSKQNVEGDTPLHYALEKGFKNIAAILIANGADGNVRNKKGKTPLEYAMNNWK